MNLDKFLFSLLCIILFFSCTDTQKTDVLAEDAFEDMDSIKVLPTFFPIQTFIMGEIETMSTKNKDILKIEKIKETDDSVKITLHEWKKIATSLFYPAIDSLTLGNHFIENKFFDNSIGLITLTYEQKENKPDGIPWKNWYVYINPDNQEISRLFFVKKSGEMLLQQITWKPGQYCKVVTINEDPLCNLNKTKELMFYWGK